MTDRPIAGVEEMADYVPAWLEAKGFPDLARQWREGRATSQALKYPRWC